MIIAEKDQNRIDELKALYGPSVEETKELIRLLLKNVEFLEIEDFDLWEYMRNTKIGSEYLRELWGLPKTPTTEK